MEFSVTITEVLFHPFLTIEDYTHGTSPNLFLSPVKVESRNSENSNFCFCSKNRKRIFYFSIAEVLFSPLFLKSKYVKVNTMK